tara:strand:- start:975 stop:1538 length:564 start_codon:yes stop_codon:yes gene_type:complete
MTEKPRFYVCSYGGCGSTVLTNSLRHHGHAYHIHDRNPPRELRLPEGEQFGETIDPNPDLARVIFIYSRPEYSQATSCAWGIQHWRNIGVQHPETIQQDRKKYAEENIDRIGLEEFFNNYLHKPRTYRVLYVNYHYLWQYEEEFWRFLGVQAQLPPFRENPNRQVHKMSIFDGLNAKIDSLPPLFVK